MTTAGVILLLGVTYLVLSRLSARRYVEMNEASGFNPERLLSDFASLKSAKVRCKLQTVGGVRALQTGSMGVTYRLLVHRDDVSKARHLLQARRGHGR